jgi:uncharacterized repeat protein (TIGR03803 family)
MHAIRTFTLGLLVASGLAGPRPAAAQYTLTPLANFTGANGANPVGGLVRDVQGNLFGTTQYGGTNGLGTVWELAAGGGTITPLASFTGANGAAPVSSLIRGAQGNLFGTTLVGGANGQGTVFELAAGSGTITSLASFTGGSASSPTGNLVRDPQGNIFGTTQSGGAFGNGTLWELAAGSGTITILASFTGANGAFPEGGLIRDAQGTLFGTTEIGGAANSGTVFELAAGTGVINTLASFPSGTFGNLAGPASPLLLDAQGNLFGTTFSGGTTFNGTVWELAAGSSTLTTIASFTGANGANPGSSLVLDAQGNFFGTTHGGGAFGDGTVWELSPVPEPGSLVLLITGLVSVAALATRARSRRDGGRSN